MIKFNSIFFLGLVICQIISVKCLDLFQQAIKTNQICYYKTPSTCTTCAQDPNLCSNPSNPKLRIGNVPDTTAIDANQVCFYLKENYKGEALCMKAGETLNLCSKKLGTVKLADNTMEGKWCNLIKSIKIGQNIALVHGKTFGGWSSTRMINSIAKDIFAQYHAFKAYAKGSNIPSRLHVPVQSDLSSPHIPKIDANQVCFYLDTNYRGKSKCMRAGETLNLCDKKFGTLKLPDGTIEGEWCDTIESILLGSNIAVVHGKRLHGYISSTQQDRSLTSTSFGIYHVYKAYARGSSIPQQVDIPVKLDVPDMTLPSIPANRACLYRQRNYRGPSLCISIGQEVNLCDEEHGGYQLNSGEYVGLWCGNIKSILFGSQVRRVDATYLPGSIPGSFVASHSTPMADILDYHRFKAT